VSAWQPIETAPKNGRHLLVTTRQWWTPVIAKWDSDRNWVSVFTGNTIGKPTHWMPLPEPPA
jgi:hypothetical protein